MMATTVEVICNLKLWELGDKLLVRVASTRLRQLVPESWGACCNGPNFVPVASLEPATAGRQVEEEELQAVCLEYIPRATASIVPPSIIRICTAGAVAMGNRIGQVSCILLSVPPPLLRVKR